MITYIFTPANIRLSSVNTKELREILHYVTIFSTISLFLIAVSLCTGRRSNEEFILFKSHRSHRFAQILDLCGLGN